jgi:hypothetical protein
MQATEDRRLRNAETRWQLVSDLLQTSQELLVGSGSRYHPYQKLLRRLQQILDKGEAGVAVAFICIPSE